jgi:hypothetical protein
MCADGSHDVMWPPGVVGRRFAIARISAIMFAWVIWTPLGGPVVPEV